MSIRLWGIMMILVLFTVGFMWIVQIIFLERNYVDSIISDVQTQIDPIMKSLRTEDLKSDTDLISYLSKCIGGKILLINQEGELMEMYSYGYPIDLAENTTEITIWEDIKESSDYAYISKGEAYSKTISSGNRLIAYEAGMPAQYGGEGAYIVIYQNFNELYVVLDMNRRQLIMITVMLTLITAISAIILARKFTKPIKIINEAVDRLTEGELTATPNLSLQDELGNLSESVEKLGKELQRVDVLRKEIIANVSHELRSPLSLIGGYAEMVRDITWTDDKRRNENLDLIIRETHRMSEMVNDILDYSQLQSGYVKLKKVYCNLYEIVESEVKHCEKSAVDYHISIKIESAQTNIRVLVDTLKLNQVMRNLLYNAINHTADGEEIEVKISETDKNIKVAIINPGVPIPEEDRIVIWERYQRSQHQGSRRQGTGIGLSIVSTILEAHKMKYGVDCEGGKTIFWFSILKAR